MYNNKTSFVYGFHGIDEHVARKILHQEDEFKHSNNDYDWLGEGTYFWENNFERANQYAVEDSKRKNSKINSPFVLGTVIDLGNCLDLLDQEHLDFLKVAYEDLKKTLLAENKSLPVNKGFGPEDFDFRKRELDCAVIRWAHQLAREQGVHFDTVRAAFWEGDELYPNAGFRQQNHIQIAVLNPNCIKGIFIPRNKVTYP
ncbi:hypothetical protein P3638_05080 [Vibrio parahaemolyticus]|uniref:hypothetical protein n=2 Tax=Vibrio harveyi group TaxID=717610 RepID=UPI001A2C1E7D|nr:hypothetical protein [Vibrio parahaemolyticus]MBO0178651.1 hypothetical protein [Vibrio parahaemolyticus]MCI9700798.1 hypothetical protein [Vibrio parahaemolyticus]MCR9814822.1 hypothetical protein [Vibrio parahaemolyticus]MDF4288952.1 hypothetical protein [Vibrio parahaemolyticus]MDF4303498.1 hypothetical protein [Vibrio parahaemolyticus]